jgi:hypothetical protein
MTLYFGPTFWWFINGADSPDDKHYCAIAACCPVGTATRDGARLICKAGGIGWFVAPSSTQVLSSWAGGQYNSTAVGDKCCISEWSTLETALTNAGFTPTDWFVPSGGAGGQLNNPGYVCRTNWDSFDAVNYWSSTEGNATAACRQDFTLGNITNSGKTNSNRVRAFRCVTY